MGTRLEIIVPVTYYTFVQNYKNREKEKKKKNRSKLLITFIRTKTERVKNSYFKKTLKNLDYLINLAYVPF